MVWGWRVGIWGRIWQERGPKGLICQLHVTSAKYYIEGTWTSKSWGQVLSWFAFNYIPEKKAVLFDDDGLDQ